MCGVWVQLQLEFLESASREPGVAMVRMVLDKLILN